MIEKTVGELAEARIGEELAKMPKAKGGGTGANKHRAAGSKRAPAATPTLKEIGVGKKRSARAQKLASSHDGVVCDAV